MVHVHEGQVQGAGGGLGRAKPLSKAAWAKRSLKRMAVRLVRRSCPWPTTMAATISWVSPGAMVKGPLDSMKRRSEASLSSQPLPRTGSPGLA